jgi:O-methyltransferase involved in polyketide biosynthesis
MARLNYPFERFETPYGGLAARLHATRVRTVDKAVRQLLAGTPEATVVALGEGFETQFWRVDNRQVNWLSLDLPEVVSVRRRVLADGPRHRTLAGSAADGQWTQHVDRERPVIITAQGLFPYFGAEEVHGMLTAWVSLLPGAWLVFDAVTASLQETRRRNPLPEGYRPPEWTWTVDAAELGRLRSLPGVTDLHEVRAAGGDLLLGVLRGVPGMRSRLQTLPVFQARLGGIDAAKRQCPSGR